MGIFLLTWDKLKDYYQRVDGQLGGKFTNHKRE